MSQSYTASDIEVLSGLEPVRRRPGMYTHTSRPNHLAHEVIDNSVDEAIAGYCKQIDVTLYKDGSLEVADDGRGMPVDIHPKEKVSGVELILTRLHAGGKFSDKTYKFSGGLHGVGVSVVNALSKHLECWIKRGGKEYNISFKDGKVASKLEVIGTVGAAQYRHHGALLAGSEVLRLGQVLRPAAQAHAQSQGGAVSGAARHASQRGDAARRTSGSTAAISAPTSSRSSARTSECRAEPITGNARGGQDAVDYALLWAPRRRSRRSPRATST